MFNCKEDNKQEKRHGFHRIKQLYMQIFNRLLENIKHEHLEKLSQMIDSNNEIIMKTDRKAYD